jgi:hypothetical protein
MWPYFPCVSWVLTQLDTTLFVVNCPYKPRQVWIMSAKAIHFCFGFLNHHNTNKNQFFSHRVIKPSWQKHHHVKMNIIATIVVIIASLGDVTPIEQFYLFCISTWRKDKARTATVVVMFILTWRYFCQLGFIRRWDTIWFSFVLWGLRSPNTVMLSFWEHFANVNTALERSKINH